MTYLDHLEYLRCLASKVTNTLRQNKVPRGTPKSTIEYAVIRIMQAEQDIQEEVDRLIAVKNEIAGTIEQAEAEEHRLLLELRYLCFNSWGQIAVKMGYSSSYVYKLHSSALAKMDQVLRSGRRPA